MRIIRAKRIVPVAKAIIYDGTNIQEIFDFTGTQWSALSRKIGESCSQQEFIDRHANNTIYVMYKDVPWAISVGNVLCIENDELYIYKDAEKFATIFEQIEV